MPTPSPDVTADRRPQRYYYEALGDGHYRPTRWVQGAWNDWEQHMAPVGGILAHAIEQHDPRPDLQLARISYEILGLIKLTDLRIDVRVVRPGRTIELVEATMTIEDRVAVRANAWRLTVTDTAALQGGWDAPLPATDELPVWDMSDRWSGDYIASLDVRASADDPPGRRHAWLRTEVGLVQGETASPTADFLKLVDTANGIGVRAAPGEVQFPNVDLTIHLFRAPRPGWLGLDTEVTFGPTGVGLTASTLHDEQGAVGRVAQILTVRPRG